jgi:hypothetical protein
MLKRVFINNKKVPVPVPIRTLGEALRWVDTTLVPAGHTITRVALNDRVLGDFATIAAHEGERPDLAQQSLTDESRLEVQIDSPVDLTVQTLDAMRNLAAVVMTGLKPLAVECWQSRPTTKPNELDAVANDLQLILELAEHIATLIDPMHVEAAAIQGIAAMVKRTAVSLQMARSNSDWRACAKLLLNRLEPLMKDLVNESETLQIRVLTAGTEFTPTGSGSSLRR